MPLNLNGAETHVALGKVAQQKPETEVAVTATDADGGTVRGEVTSTGTVQQASWSASAWYQLAKEKGRTYGGKFGLKF